MYEIEYNQYSYRVYGNWVDAKGKEHRFLAMQTWSKERAAEWIAGHGISADGMITMAEVA